jgi:diazepam-binding inhibitor (GABA receptor modulating acyl-CoA-binding protein)
MADFEKYAEGIKNTAGFVDGLSDENKLNVYGTFKQASTGDCNIARPGMFDPKGKAKWDAWDAKKGMSQEDARQAYVDLLTELGLEL